MENSADNCQITCKNLRIAQEIGRGAYGVVYLATVTGGGHAAVKVCRRAEVGDERYERELRGARLYKTIPAQEGLVRMRELVEEPWGFYTEMDLADDEFDVAQGAAAEYRPKTLARVIEGEKALPLNECVKLAISLAKGLTALQRHHLLHRDIKPANVLYVGGRPVLSDPGLVVEESVAVSTVGTPGYLPPERKFIDSSSDIYSLGLTLKSASFGRPVEDLDKGPAMEADTLAPHFAAWWKILNKATDPTPSRRYQSAKALLKELKSLQNRIVLHSIAASRMVKILVAVAAIGVIAAIAAFSAIGRRNQAQTAADQAKAAAEEARAALVRRALRDTFDGISEEKLEFLVEKDRLETFGGVVSEEDKAKARKIATKYLLDGFDDLPEKTGGIEE